MKNRNKTLKIALTVFLVSALILSAFFVTERNKRFSFAEKNTVAMGTVLTQKIYSQNGANHISHVTSIVNSLENTISRHKENTAVSILNEKGIAENATVAEILSRCNEISRMTDGRFDVTVGKLSDLWAIGEENEGIPDEKKLKAALKSAGYESITVKDGKIALSSDCAVDLGAVGKGLACDYIMNYLKAADDIDGAVVSVGGSNVAYGKYNKAGDEWRIAVRHPRNENAFLGVISLSEGFVSTSGDYEKYFEQDGKRYHHILDGKTGYPASSGLISVTVVCDSGFLSDALSTACFIVGEEESKVLLEKYNASAIFVNESMEVSVVGEVDFEAY